MMTTVKAHLLMPACSSRFMTGPPFVLGTGRPKEALTVLIR